MDSIRWGIIGCGDVAEVKSGPAFQKIENSSLIGVMRRNGEKAKDFAQRHGVDNWYANAQELLENPDINAIYVATPPSTHLKYALDALDAGKHVYLEKPMTLNSKEAIKVKEAVVKSEGKLTIAHYRRKLPAFVKVKELLKKKAIGDVHYANIQILQPKNSDIIANTGENWRVDPKVSGGGFFYDLAPHQIDLMYHYFGPYKDAVGFSNTEEGVEDTVNGVIAFENGVQFRGIWNFKCAEQDKIDECTIYGSNGKISFPFYGNSITVRIGNEEEITTFRNPKHVQYPMIESTVAYFLGSQENPCPAEQGVAVMKMMEKLCGK